jgi:hypothetical protein
MGVPPRVGLAGIVLLWAALSSFGLVWLAKYKGTPGADPGPPPSWPAGTQLALAGDRPTLVLFAHPQCECTQATLAELDRLMTRIGQKVDATVVMVVPPRAGDGFANGGLAERARHIAGVRVVVDSGGSEAARFEAETSGDVVLYDPRGRLLFHGGITLSRGHEGENPGAERIAALVGGGQAIASAPVFGCSLQDPRPTREQ